MRNAPDWTCTRCYGQFSCTDTPGRYECESDRCENEQWLLPTRHVENRWDVRTHDKTTNVTEAFERGVTLDERHDLIGDEIRYDHDSRMAIIRKDVGVTTVIDVLSARQRIREAAIRTTVTELTDPTATGELCAEMGVDVEQFKEITNDLRDNDPDASSGKTSGQTTTRKPYSDRSAVVEDESVGL